MLDKAYGRGYYGCATCCGHDKTTGITWSPNPYTAAIGNGTWNTLFAYNMCYAGWDDVTPYGTGWNSTNTAVASVATEYTNLVGAGAASGFTNSINLDTNNPRTNCAAAPFTVQSQSINSNPTVSIYGSLGYVYTGHDPQVTQHINGLYATGTPSGGSFQWSSPDSSISFDNSASATVHMTATSYSGGTNDTQITVNYSYNNRPATPASVWLTKRIFKFLDGDLLINVTNYSGPSQYGYVFQAQYNVKTNPGGQLVSDGNGVATAESVSTVSTNVAFNPNYGSASLDQNSHVLDNLSLTNNSPLPPNLNIVQTQDIAVGGFYVRTNTITFTATGVSISSNGPYN